MPITKTLHSLYILLIFLLKMWPAKALFKLTVQRTLHPAVPAKNGMFEVLYFFICILSIHLYQILSVPRMGCRGSHICRQLIKINSQMGE